jgi:competence protein ComEC
MHLGILVSFIWWLCRIAGLLKRARSVICIIALCVFLMIVPPRAPTLRAAIICFVFCLSFLFRRRTNHLNNLSLAAIVLLLMRPTGLFEAGWQLSFASVLGILIFTDRIYFFTYENVTRWSFFKTTKKRNLLIRLASKAADYSLALLCVGLAAWLGGAGILLYHFYTINPLTSLWTVIVFPLVVLILAFGYLKIIMSFLLPTLSYFLGIMVNDISALMLWIVNFIASLNLSEILIGHIPVIVVIIYYCLLIFIVFGHIRRLFIKQAVYSASVLVLLLVLGGLKWQRSYRQNLVLTALDVGHGQAIVIQLPNSKNLLFDTGSLYIKDVGQRIVVPFLQYSGINSIDAIVISHNDIDHINGIPEIARSWDVRHIYAASTFFQDYDKWGTSRFLKSSVAESGLDIKRLPDELRVKGTDKINFIWPNEQALKAQYLSENDKSLVSLIEFGNSRILLCSDIEKTAQKRILQLYPDLRCEVMVVPHHGSINTLDENFTDKLDGQIYICICDHRQFERLQEKSQGNKTGWARKNN